jgi:SAM-dependent methyltransferase
MIRNDPDRDWERFGIEDPYYSMLNTERYRSRTLDDDLVREVLQTGEANVEYFLHFAEQRFGPLPRGRALEFGCGVGRHVLPLARQYASVTAVDVAASMLAEAERNCAREELTNVELVRSDDALSQVEGAFDLVLSYLVFQHIPVRRGEAIIERLLERVTPGGIAAIHVTTGRSSPRWRQVVHVLRRNFTPLHYLGNVASGMRWNEPMMQTNLYDGTRLKGFAASSGLGDLVELPVQHADHVGHILFAQRPAEPKSAERDFAS